MEIIPAILVKSFEEFRQKFELVKNLVRWIQLDVVDGVFAPQKTWGDPAIIKNFEKRGVAFEIHLMVADPEKEIAVWLDAGVERLYFHYEASKSPEMLISELKSHGIKPGIALLVDTPIESITSFLESLDAVLLFSGSLGFYGGKFDARVLPKIKELRRISKDITIGVDGGIKPETAKQCFEAGADTLVAGSYIFGQKDVKKAIEELKNSLYNY